MVATPARIGFIKEEFRHVIAETASARARHGNAARESEVPVETYFDNPADAQVIADQRQALLSPERRRFRTVTRGIDEVLALDYSGAVPVARYVDTERQVDGKMLVSAIVIDTDKQQAAVMVWG